MWTIFHAIKRSWTQHFVAQFSAFLVMSMTYGAVIFIAISLTNIQKVFDVWGEVNRVSVYINGDQDKKKKEALESYFKSHEIVKGFELISSDQSASQFNKRFSNISSQKLDTKKLKKFFPQYYVVDLNKTLAYKSGVGQLEKFSNDLTSSYPFIGNVSYGKKWLSRYVNLLSLLKSIGGFLILVFMIAAVVVSSSVIKTILFSRRDEIEILEFIGADDLSIYMPQVVNVLFLGCASFFTALGMNYLAVQNLQQSSLSISQQSLFQGLEFLSPLTTVAMVTVCLLSLVVYSVLTIFNLMPRRKKAILIKEVFHS